MNNSIMGVGNLLDELKSTDLNGLLTASSMYRSLLREIARSSRYGNPLSIVRFKIAESEDMSAQDRAKIRRLISDKLGDNARVIDYVGSWTEDEFLIFLPETNLKKATGYAQKMKSVLEEDQPLAVHIGVAEWAQQDDASSLLEKTEIKT